MIQSTLFPIRIRREMPANTGTADLKLVGQADDGHTYAMKTLNDGPLLPMTEWVCHQFCRAVGIATPDFAAVHRLDESVAFGSRIEKCWQVAPHHGDPVEVQIARLFSFNVVAQSRIFGLDAFVGNVDRHLGNFLFRPTSTGPVPLAFDFSQAWVHLQMPFGSVPWQAQCNSSECVRYLRALDLFDTGAAIACVEALGSLPASLLSDVLATCHPSWLEQFNRGPTLHVWEQQRPAHSADARLSLR